MLLHTLFAATSLLLLRSLARNKKTVRASFVINAVLFSALYVTGLFLVAIIGGVDISVHSTYALQFMAGGLGFALFNICTYKLLTYLDAATSGMLGTFKVLFTILLAGIVLHEKLTLMQLFGSTVLLCAIIYVLIITKKTSIKARTNHWLPGLFFAVVGSFIFAIANINEKYLLGEMNIATYLFFGWGWQWIISLGLAVLQHTQVKAVLTLSNIKVIGLAGITLAFSGFWFIESAVQNDNVALTTVVGNFRLVVVAVLGALILKERQMLGQKLLSIILATVGLVLIFWK